MCTSTPGAVVYGVYGYSVTSACFQLTSSVQCRAFVSKEVQKSPRGETCYLSTESSLQSMAWWKSRFVHSQYAKTQKSAGVTVKSQKCSLGRISYLNWIPITGKQTKCSGKLSGVFAEKDFILLDPSKTKMVSYSTIRKTSVADHFRQLPPTCQNKEGWDGCRLRWIPIWNA